MARKILLADDSVTAQNMGRKILVDAGYEVVTVNNGSAALKRINESKPDLIVLDVYMPGYSGLEVCQRLKESGDTAQIPVLLTVGKLEPFKTDEARRVRADAHIVKPFEASELLSALARLEERMASADAGAFSGDPDTGWASRLRIGGKKKKEAQEEDNTAANFRDFRQSKGSGKGQSKGKTTDRSLARTEEAASAPEQVPDIPRDITPDELDALSALAAQMESPPLAERLARAMESVNQAETPAPSAENAETMSEAVQAEPGPAKISEAGIAQVEKPTGEAGAPGSVEVIPVSPALLAQEPAPIDQSDEPLFAVAAAATLSPSEEELVRPAEAVASIATSTEAERPGASAEESPVVEPALAHAAETDEQEIHEQPAVEAAHQSEAEATVSEVKEEVKTEEPTQVEIASAASSLAEAVLEGRSPTDEELAEALRLLTPLSGAAEVAMPSQETLVAAGQMLAEEAARNLATPRWVAEPVALTTEEAAISLEAEMFRTFATQALGEIGVSPMSGLASTKMDAVVPQMPETESPGDVSNADSAAMAVSDSAAAPVPECALQEPSAEAPGTELAPTAEIAPEHDQHAAAAVAAESQAIEATADEETSADVPKAMAAAASAEGAPAEATSADSASTGDQESIAIANIVDSVLADLRPKIVEEITKKLRKK